jgi:hypothetical protein
MLSVHVSVGTSVSMKFTAYNIFRDRQVVLDNFYIGRTPSNLVIKIYVKLKYDLRFRINYLSISYSIC